MSVARAQDAVVWVMLREALLAVPDERFCAGSSAGDSAHIQEEPEEGTAGHRVSPPRVGWPDVAAWMVEDSCVTVDLRKCDEASHQWLVERYMEPEALGQIPPRRIRRPHISLVEITQRFARSQGKARSAVPAPSKRGARSRSALGRGESPRETAQAHEFFAHAVRLRAPKRP